MSEEREDGIPSETDDQEPDQTEELDQAEELDAGDADEAPPEEEIAERPPERRPQPGPRQRLARENRELKERTERLERDLAQIRQQQAAPRADPYEAQRREQEWLNQVALLPPDQAAAAWAQRTRGEVAAALQQNQQTVTDQIDRTSWDSACRTDPVRRQYARQVEEIIQGLPPSAIRNRETVFAYVYGKEVLRRREAGLRPQRQAAARRVAQQTTRPANGAARSDGPRQREQTNSSNASVEERWRRLMESGRPLWE